MNGKLRNGAITSVIAPNVDGEWEEVTTKDAIERGCLAENFRRFSQTSSTPPMTAPLVDDLTYLGIGPQADSILRGEYQAPEGTDPFAVKLLKHLKMDPAINAAPPVPIAIPTAIWQQGWRKANERTSAGPSKLTMAHFKAGCERLHIADFEATMANIPYATGYSPKRWCNGINAMLEKKKNNFRVDCLRTIMLYDVEFNMTNKILGRDTMAQAERYGGLAPEQYGSRKQKSANDHALNKRLTFDIIRQKRQAAAMTSCDAKSCYDRIVHSIAALSMRRQGVQEPPIVCMFTTIQNLVHTVRTAFGDSTESFGGDLWAVPVQGVGQGNGAGPMIWAVVSTPLLEMLREDGFGTFFRLAISREQIRIVGFAFVDDTDLIQTAKSPDDSGMEVAAEMQASLDTWEGGLRATGGALVPAKSWWYLVEFEWKDGEWAYVQGAEDDISLQVRDCDGNYSMLERLDPDEARKTLGVWLAPDGNNAEQVSQLRQVAEDWREKIRTGHLTRKDAWDALQMTVLKTLEYPLVALTLTEDECTHIMAPILERGLPAAGICRTMT